MSLNPALMLQVPTALIVCLIVLAVAIVIFIVLWIVGKRLQKRRDNQDEMIRSLAQTVSILVIDKKKLKITEAGLPKEATDEVKWYGKLQKVPVVRVKVQNRFMNLLADPRVFDSLPIKCEAKVVISGLYITEIRSIRGGSVLPPKQKKTMKQRITGFFKKK